MTIKATNAVTGDVSVLEQDAPSFLAPVMTVTRGQFLLAAAAAGIITEAVAEEAADGSWPAAFNTFIAGLSASQRIVAKATWADGRTVNRSNPILALIAADQGVNEAGLDALFAAAAGIAA